tara:strand:- start:1054 stop:1323 length:270 start_codon:yes stop_codon:yes gene_type:complete
METTTIQIDKSLKEKLDSIKIHPRETFNELILRLLDNCSLDNASRESLIATLEIMQDPETMREIAQALEEIEKGNYGTPLEEVKKELGL